MRVAHSGIFETLQNNFDDSNSRVVPCQGKVGFMPPEYRLGRAFGWIVAA